MKNLVLLLSVGLFSISSKAQNAQALQDYLSKGNLELQLRWNQYDAQYFNRVIDQKRVLITQSKDVIAWNGSIWEYGISANSVASNPEAKDLRIVFYLVKGTLKDASISIDLIQKKWSIEHYVLMPGAVYQGNRFDWRRIGYSPKLIDPKDFGANKPTIISDVPKLNKDNGPSRIQERSGGMSTPAIGYFTKNQKSFWLLSSQKNAWGDYGMDLEESKNKTEAIMSMTSPVVRELYKYRITDSRFPSDDVPASFKTGDSVDFKVRLYLFDAPQLQALFTYFTKIRKDLSGEPVQKDVLPFSSCMQTLEKKFNQDNWDPKYGYYAVGDKTMFLQDWQIGWTGGMISTYPLLFAGNEQTQKNVIRNFDWLFPNGIAPSGFFWDSGEKGHLWYGGDIRKPTASNWHLVRKSGDGLYYILKQFELMKAKNVEVKKTWEDGTQGVAEAFVKLWKSEKQLGQFVDSQTGKIAVGGSTSGAIVPGALALAAAYYHQPEYLKVAQEIGAYYDSVFVKRGITTGGPGDALQNPDSESCYALLESYITLYEATHDPIWIKRSEDIAEQFITWVSSYNFEFPKTSSFGKLGILSAGAVAANAQNRHGAPNICTHSGVGLLKLYRYTGKSIYLKTLQEIAHNQTQYMSHPSRPIADLPMGWMSERVSTTDWLEGIGEIVKHTTWAETALMLSCVEIPSIYLNTKTNELCVFDHVGCQPIKGKNGKIKSLKIENTTKEEATITIWIDRDLSKDLENNYLLKAKKLKVKGMSSVEIGL